MSNRHPALRSLDQMQRYAYELADTARFHDWTEIQPMLCRR